MTTETDRLMRLTWTQPRTESEEQEWRQLHRCIDGESKTRLPDFYLCLFAVWLVAIVGFVLVLVLL